MTMTTQEREFVYISLFIKLFLFLCIILYFKPDFSLINIIILWVAFFIMSIPFFFLYYFLIAKYPKLFGEAR